MKPTKLEDLSKERVKLPNPSKSICKYKQCEYKGFYERCYLHTWAFCPRFQNYYVTLNTVDRLELLKGGLE